MAEVFDDAKAVGTITVADVSDAFAVGTITVADVSDAFAVGTPEVANIEFVGAEFKWPNSEDWIRIYAEAFHKNQTAYVESAENLTIYDRTKSFFFRGVSAETAERELVVTQLHYDLSYTYVGGWENDSLLSAAGGTSALTPLVRISRADNGDVLAEEVLYPTSLEFSSAVAWASINSTDMTVSTQSRGSVVGDARSVEVSFVGTISNGDIIEGTVLLTQEANELTVSDAEVVVSPSVFEAQGGSGSLEFRATKSYTSGVSSTGSLSGSLSVVSVADGVSFDSSSDGVSFPFDVASKGTVLSAQTVLSSEVRFTSDDGFEQLFVVDVTQAANEVVDETFTGTLTGAAATLVPADGGSYGFGADYVVSFSSGAVLDYPDENVLLATSWSEDVDWLSVVGTSLEVANRGSVVGAERVATVTGTYTGLTGNPLTVTLQVRQEANALTGVSLGDDSELVAPAGGASLDVAVVGSYTSGATVSLTNTSPFTYDAPSWVTVRSTDSGFVFDFVSRGTEVGDAREGSVVLYIEGFSVEVSVTQVANVVESRSFWLEQDTDSSVFLASGGTKVITAYSEELYTSGESQVFDVSLLTTFTKTIDGEIVDGGAAGGGVVASKSDLIAQGTPSLLVDVSADIESAPYVLTMADRGTTEGPEISIIISGTYSGESNSLSFTQEANVATVGAPEFSVAYSPSVLPASGGSSNLTLLSFSQVVSYTSGASTTLSSEDVASSGQQSQELGDSTLVSSVEISENGTITLGSLGTTVTPATSAEVIVTLTTMGVSGTAVATISQEANESLSGSLEVTSFSYDDMSASDVSSGLPTIDAYYTGAFSSGAQSAAERVDADYVFSLVGDAQGATINSTNGTILWSKNDSASARSLSVSVLATYGGVSADAVTTTITQGSGTKTYADPVVTVSYPVISAAGGTKTYADPVVTVSYPVISAAGGTVTPTISYSQTWGWNGLTSGGGTITSGGSVSYSGTGVSTSNGSVSADSKGTVVSDVTDVTTATVSVTLNGKTGSTSYTVQQAANAKTSITYGTPEVSLTYGSKDASSGTVSPSLSYSQSRVQNYTSGSTESLSALTSGGTVSYSETTANSNASVNSSTGVVTWSENQSTSDRTVGITVSVTLNSKTGSKAATSKQLAGSYTYGAWVVSISANPTSIGVTGGSSTITASASRTYGWNGDTSGAGTQSGTVALSIPSTTGASLSGTTSGSKLTWTSNAQSPSTRSVVVTATCQEDTSKKGTVTITQAKDTYTDAYEYRISTLSVSPTSATAAAGSFTVSGTVQRRTRRDWSGSGTTTYPVSWGALGSVTPTVSDTGSWTTVGTVGSTNSSGVSTTTVSYTANTSTSSSRSTTVTMTYSGASKTATFTQNADAVASYSTPTVNLSYSTISVAGGSVTPTVSYTQRATYYSGNYEDIMSGGSVSYSGTGVNTSTGSVSANSKGTSISNVTTVTTATASVTLNGKTGSKSYTVKQAGNYVTTVTPSVSSFGYSNIGAGATSASASVSNGSTTFKFTSGSTTTTAPSSTYGSLSASNSYALSASQNGFTAVNSSSGALTATSRGTAIGNARTSGTVTLTRTATWTPATSYNSGGTKSGTATKTASCVQAGNYVTSISASSSNRTLTYGQAAASGGTLTPIKGGYLGITFNYSSGSSGSSLPSSTYGSLGTTSTSFSGSASGTFGAPNSSTGAVVVSSRGTTEGAVTSGSAVTMTETVTWTPTSSYNSAGTKTAIGTTKGTPTQAANTATVSTVYDGTITVSISASAGTSSSSPLSAGGGTSTLSYSASQAGRTKYAWTSGATSYSSYNTSTARTPSVTGSATGFSLSGTTVTAADRGTTVGDARSVTYTATYSGVSKSVTIYQQANTPTVSAVVADAGVSSVFFTYSGGTSVSAGGATLNPTANYAGRIKFTSGADSGVVAAGTYYGHSLSFALSDFSSSESWATVGATTGVVTVVSRGTTAGAARTAQITGTVTATWNGYSGTLTQSRRVMQNANTATDNTTLTVSLSYSAIAGGTTSVSPTVSGMHQGDVTYSSGSVQRYPVTSIGIGTANATFSFVESSPMSSSATVNSSTGVVTWGTNDGTSARSVGVTVTLTYLGKTATASAVSKQNSLYTDWVMSGGLNVSTIVPIPVTEEAHFTTTWSRYTPSGQETMEVDCSPASFYNDGSYGSGYRIYVQYVSPTGSITGGEYVDVDS